MHVLQWNNPSITIFTISLLSSLTILFLDLLMKTACDSVRWRFATRPTGVSLLDFTALAGTTSWVGLVQLLFSLNTSKKVANSATTELRNLSYRCLSAE